MAGIVPTQRLQPPANDKMLAGDGQLTQAWQQYFQRVSDQTKTLQDALHTGTTTNDDAAAGMVGEFITASIASGGAVLLASNVAAEVTSVSLTAGDWDVWGSVGFTFAAGAGRTYVTGAIGLAVGVSGLPTGGGVATYSSPPATVETGIYPVTPGRLSIAAPTTVYLSAAAGYSGGVMRAYGFIAARRAR